MYDSAISASLVTEYHVLLAFLANESIGGSSGWTGRDMEDLVLNFAGLSAGEDPAEPVPVVVNLKHSLMGDVGGCEVADLYWEEGEINDKASWLLIAVISMPLFLARLIETNKLNRSLASITDSPPGQLLPGKPYTFKGKFLEQINLDFEPDVVTPLALRLARFQPA